MSNGYYRLARVETDHGIICIDQGWGAYADFAVSITPTGGTDLAARTREIDLTREQYGELLRQMNEYAMREPALAVASKPGIDADEFPF